MEQDDTVNSRPSPTDQASQDHVSLERIHALLQAKDDTQRFVGLALLKSVLDNSPRLRGDEVVIQGLWASLSAKFLSRLLHSGSSTTANRNDSRQMLGLAVSILHTFSILLPEEARQGPKFTGRVPALVAAVLHSSEESTTTLILQLLATLASSTAGAAALVQVNDLTPLTEIAPSQPLVMDILSLAWLNSMAAAAGVDKARLREHVGKNMQSLASSFTGTDAVTFLGFLAGFLGRADPECLPAGSTCRWLKTAVGFIRNLVSSRPTPEARYAYTTAAASLLQAFPHEAAQLLFAPKREEGHEPQKKPVDPDRPTLSYLLINLVLIDIRSSAPVLLEQLNTPGYAQTARRIASAFDIVCFFIGYLLRSLEDDETDEDDAHPNSSGLIMSPGHLLKLRKTISETMSVTIEYLRDRWDASFAGAMGLHPDARPAAAATSSGTHRTLAWDSSEHAADEDPLILAAVRALALWLREDENEMLRKEATGLTDMFLELYLSGGPATASNPRNLDFRSPALVAMEALVTFDKGRDALLRNDGWRVMSADLHKMFVSLPQASVAVTEKPEIQRSEEEEEEEVDDQEAKGGADLETEATRGIELVRVLLQLVEQAEGNTPEAWMDTVTKAAAWDVSHTSGQQQRRGARAVTDLQIAVLQLCCALLAKASGGMRRRYVHSTSALLGIAASIDASVPRDYSSSSLHSTSLTPLASMRESIDDVLDSLRGLSQR